MKNHKTNQEFPFTLAPASITSGTHQGKTEIHIQEKYTAARIGGKHSAEMALTLFQKNLSLTETDTLKGPCVVRTAQGFQAGRLCGHHGTTESMCIIVADLKPMAGRTLTLARLGACKQKLSQKYGRLAAKCGSTGRREVLCQKMVTYRTAAHSQWVKVFQLLAKTAVV